MQAHPGTVCNNGFSMKKAIIFDFGQTLADSSNGFRTAERVAQKKLFLRLSTVSWDDFLPVYREYRKAFQEKSDFSRPAIWAKVCGHFSVKPEAGFLKALEEEYWGTVEAQTALFPETLHVLAGLAPTYRLALVTNTQGQKGSAKHRIDRFSALEGIFRVMIVAGESGVPPKPDPIPFRLCLQRLGISPAEAVFVGDDWRIDIQGAMNAGIQPIWLRHRLVQRTWPDVGTPVPTIDSLDTLLDVECLLFSAGDGQVRP